MLSIIEVKLDERIPHLIVNLRVIELSSEPIILHNGTMVDKWIELKEDQNLTLECITTTGGNPSLNITC